MIFPRYHTMQLIKAACDAAEHLPWHDPCRPEREGGPSDAGRELRRAVEELSRWIAKEWGNPIPDGCHGAAAGEYLLYLNDKVPL